MQTRSTIALMSLLAVTACGGSDKPEDPDAPPPDIGFNRPTASLRANNNDTEIGPADLTCLGTPSADLPTTLEITLTTTVKDFQNGSIMPGAGVTAFLNTAVTQPFQTQTADASGMVTFMIPSATRRFGFKMSHPDALDTLLLNQKVDPNTSPQTFGSIDIVSKTTATLLPALISKTRTPGTGVLAGAMRDCQGREVSNFIATVSSTRGTVTHLPGADAYYFDPMAGLPVRHNQRGSASADGLFMVIEIAPTPVAYVQVWGYPTDTELAADDLKLIAELQVPVIADTVITGTYEPLRQ